MTVDSRQFNVSERSLQPQRSRQRVGLFVALGIGVVVMLAAAVRYGGFSWGLLFTVLGVSLAVGLLTFVIVKFTHQNPLDYTSEHYATLTAEGVERFDGAETQRIQYQDIEGVAVSRQAGKPVGIVVRGAGRRLTFVWLEDMDVFLEDLTGRLESGVKVKEQPRFKNVLLSLGAAAAGYGALRFISNAQSHFSFDQMFGVVSVGFGIYYIVARPLTKIYGKNYLRQELFTAVAFVVFGLLRIF